MRRCAEVFGRALSQHVVQHDHPLHNPAGKETKVDVVTDCTRSLSSDHDNREITDDVFLDCTHRLPSETQEKGNADEDEDDGHPDDATPDLCMLAKETDCIDDHVEISHKDGVLEKNQVAEGDHALDYRIEIGKRVYVGEATFHDRIPRDDHDHEVGYDRERRSRGAHPRWGQQWEHELWEGSHKEVFLPFSATEFEIVEESEWLLAGPE
jgi:hypothetical protein